MEPLTALPYVDSLIKEYLLFRGFTQTLLAFNAEMAQDKGCGFQADQISELVFRILIPQHKGDELMQLFEFLRTCIFARLDGHFESGTQQLEASVLRSWLVKAVEAHREELVKQFFSRHGDSLMQGPNGAEWGLWFALPFLQSPAGDPRFQVYFGREWQSLVEASFRNFLAEAIQQLPLPALLRFDSDRRMRVDLQKRVAALSLDNSRLTKRLAAAQQRPLPAEGTGFQQAASAAAAYAVLDTGLGAGSSATYDHTVPKPSAMDAVQSSPAAAPKGSTASQTSLRTVPPEGARARATEPSAAVEAGGEAAAPFAVVPPSSVASGLQVPAEFPEKATLPRRLPGAERDPIRSEEWLAGHQAPVTAMCWGPEGRNLATASSDGEVRVWAPTCLPTSDASRAAVQGCGAPVSCLAWDARADKVMLVGTRGKGIKAWHLDTKRMVSQMRLDPPFTEVADLACSPSEATFVCAAEAARGSGEPGCRLSLWNTRSFKKTHTFGIPGDPVMCSLDFSADGRTLVTGGLDGVVRMFDSSMKSLVVHWSPQTKHAGPVFVRYTGDGRRVLTLGGDGLLKIWDTAGLGSGPTEPIETAQLDASPFCSSFSSSYRHRFAGDPSGNRFAFTSVHTQVPLACLDPGELEEPVEGPGKGHPQGGQWVGGPVHAGAVTAVAWHPKEAAIASGAADHSVCVACVDL